MTSEIVETSVLIVGGGPAGLTASLLLSRHGVDSLLIDKRLTASPLPRARGVHSRAMEILRVCGVEPDLRAMELPITPGAASGGDRQVPGPGRPARPGVDPPAGPHQLVRTWFGNGLSLITIGKRVSGYPPAARTSPKG